jgi:hypothetical protein
MFLKNIDRGKIQENPNFRSDMVIGSIARIRVTQLMKAPLETLKKKQPMIFFHRLRYGKI